MSRNVSPPGFRPLLFRDRHLNRLTNRQLLQLLQALRMLALHAVIHGVEHRVDCHLGHEGGFGPRFEDTGTDQDAKPDVVAAVRVIELVGAADVGFGGVADEEAVAIG